MLVACFNNNYYHGKVQLAVNSCFNYGHFQISKYKTFVTLGLVINQGGEGIQNSRGVFYPYKKGVNRKGFGHRIQNNLNNLSRQVLQRNNRMKTFYLSIHFPFRNIKTESEIFKTEN